MSQPRIVARESTCSWCRQTFAYASAWPRRTCSITCREALRSATMARTNRSHASARMTARNPMRSPTTRALVSSTLREIGHRPPIRGGNGRPTPAPQRMLAKALGWPTELVVPTGPGGKARGLSTHYKLDVASAAEMIAIEVDGASHAALTRLAQDAKKEAFLRGLGWKVLRFTNQEILTNLPGCLAIVDAARSSTSRSTSCTTTTPAAS